MMKLLRDFYTRDVLSLAPELLGKSLVRRFPDGTQSDFIITETEAYRGVEDLACHASKGRTERTEIMYDQGGKVYMYLIYGMYWMLNIVSGEKDFAQAVLIRGIEGFDGPGKLSRKLMLDKTFYGEDLVHSERLWLQDKGLQCTYQCSTRINVDYAGEFWKSKPWRFILTDY